MAPLGGSTNFPSSLKTTLVQTADGDFCGVSSSPSQAIAVDLVSFVLVLRTAFCAIGSNVALSLARRHMVALGDVMLKAVVGPWGRSK